MSDKSIVKILEKRVTTDGSEEFLIRYQWSGNCLPTADQWLSLQDLKTNEKFHQLMAELNTNVMSKTVSEQINGTNGGKPEEEFVSQKQLNGFDRGYRPFKILGAKEVDKTLMFLVMFREDLTKADLIPNHVLHEKCPQMLIKFYEKNTLWKRH